MCVSFGNIFVIPAKAGIHLSTLHLSIGLEMDSRLRGNDDNYES
ncbi:hypothetical protein V473_15625 [Sphingobium cupriresistens LL01]|uniref:Uncharacterized protein n=1 Tax=Sphingobium cupriresistens LL01 TaxID=1420583 RepID=A0A0J7XUK0_9SPHN|nr:hypothetical protein V473_15625 [Sphingobium cupriresistens LL01]